MLSALAITDVFAVLAIAILLSGAAMLLLADNVNAFLQNNRMYEVLGLFILLIVGGVLLSEAAQAAAHATHDDTLALRFFGYEVVSMSKTTFYLSICRWWCCSWSRLCSHAIAASSTSNGRRWRRAGDAPRSRSGDQPPDIAGQGKGRLVHLGGVVVRREPGSIEPPL